ncbi:MAG: hypothetical protein AAF799_26420 [Myxococcota bacterium]
MVLRYGWKKICTAGLLACSLTACTDDGDGNGPQHSSGDLGLAFFSWSCVSDGDLACEAGDRFPSRVAVGSTYRPSFRLANRVPDEVDAGWVDIASPARATPVSNGRLRAEHEGEVTLIALALNGAVVDFTTIEQHEVADLELRLAAADPFAECDGDTEGCDTTGTTYDSLAFQPGFTSRLRVEPINSRGEPLIGDIDYEWTVRPSANVVIEDDDGNEIDLFIKRPTEFELTVSGGGIVRAFHYRTADEGPRRPRPGSMDPDTEGDSTGMDTDGTGDSGTDTGSDTGTSEGGDTEGGSSTGGDR